MDADKSRGEYVLEYGSDYATAASKRGVREARLAEERLEQLALLGELHPRVQAQVMARMSTKYPERYRGPRVTTGGTMTRAKLRQLRENQTQ